jgi:mono/diheme cytochrome c family protein
MLSARWILLLAWLALQPARAASPHRPALPASHASPDYESAIKPILTRHCVGCHGADQQKAELRLDTAQAARQGGRSGPALVPGKADLSPLIQSLTGSRPDLDRMPYKKPPLAPEEIASLRAWIDAGASAPAKETPGRSVHWAFIAPQRTPPPRLANPGWARNTLDSFLLARLETEGIAPSPEADRITLLRRVHLDLTGLPPTPDEVQHYLRDARPDAYERRVEDLLASPHFGERWARWWLDVARYADSNGYSIDAPRSLWPWRDWVVDAFNRDQPFDTFLTEQLAGDLLPEATAAQRVATGFHRNTQINQEGGIDPEQFRIESVIDRVNTTGTAFLGLTLGCAQCHDHKFDPIRQTEYFQLFAIFNNQEEPSLALPDETHAQALARHAAEIARLENRLKPAGPTGESVPVPASSRKVLENELVRLRKSKPAPATSLVLAERSTPRENYVFIKGDFTRRGPDVQPGTPAILHPLRHSPAGSNLPPNRLDLARWLSDPANPLTARVTVNRLWQQYFGRGLVETENDFGTQGIPPTHPALLDWLATELIDRAWSLKAVHRLIVTSATYRQSSRHRPDLADKDPTNRLLARQTRLRLDAEVIRDTALAASGQLDRTLGGPGVFPPQPDGVMNLGQSRREWRASTGADRFRRGLYTFRWRATPHPALAVFDAPDAFSACTRRPRSNTPLQALTLLNDEASLELSQALARRILREGRTPDRLEFAFRLCLARRPFPAERTRLERLVREEELQYGEFAAWQTVARVMLNLDETITRE